MMDFALLMFHTIRTRQLRLALSRSLSCAGLVAAGVRSSSSIDFWNLIIFLLCSGKAAVMNA